jgi:hypothetical protein
MGGHSWFPPGKKGRSVLPLREGVSSHRGKVCPPLLKIYFAGIPLRAESPAPKPPLLLYT